MIDESISSILKEHYQKTIKKYGPTPKGVDWRNDTTANKRHYQMSKLILECGKKNSLLDVGCGYGAFYEYLKAKNIYVDYNGIDFVSEMIEEAKKKNSTGKFFIGNFLDYPENIEFDYIVCNGILTQKLNIGLLEMELFAKKLIKKIFSMSKVGCCFNIMSTRCNFFAENLFYKHPSELLIYCLSEITNNVSINHSYGLYEFTVYLYKNIIENY